MGARANILRTNCNCLPQQQSVVLVYCVHHNTRYLVLYIICFDMYHTSSTAATKKITTGVGLTNEFAAAPSHTIILLFCENTAASCRLVYASNECTIPQDFGIRSQQGPPAHREPPLLSGMGEKQDASMYCCTGRTGDRM